MTILLFLLVLVVLIVVHELGHFVVAKWSGMRVDEFGLGYPPKLWGKKFGETEYTINALPFGGFVRIYGEDLEQTMSSEGEESARAFSARPRILQAATLVAGISMNLILAYVLIAATLVLGTTRALSPEEVASATNVSLTVSAVLPGSPAASAGLMTGDSIQSVEAPYGTFTSTSADDFTAFIARDTSEKPLTFNVLRGGESLTLSATPAQGVIAADPTRAGVGVAIAPVGMIATSLSDAPLAALMLTAEITKETAVGLVHFFAQALTFSADLSQVSGPVGIAGAVGTAASNGLASLLSVAAIISINLALINLFPIPALDGGRLLFVAIEALLRRPLPAKLAEGVNGIGFALLLLLMVVITGHDIFKLLA